MKWTCEGAKERIEKIADFMKKSRRHDKDAAAYKALKELDTTITALMSDPDNDERYLYTYRRQVRLLLKRISA